MRAHHLILPLALTAVGNSQIDRSLYMLAHYMNLLSIGESWILANFDINSNGTFFLAKNSKGRLEIGFQNTTLFMILPISKSRIQSEIWEKRYVIDFGSIRDIGPTLDLIITFQHNHITLYNGCDEIFSDFEPNLHLNLEHPKLHIVHNWKGREPKSFEIGSGWPIGQKCKANGVKQSNAEAYYEEIEKNYEPTTLSNLNDIFFEKVLAPPFGFNGCKVNNVLLGINETKMFDCDSCTCVDRDNVVCHAIECPPVTCEHPMMRQDDCCPTCGEQCFFEGHKLANPHGEVFWPGDCNRCQCWDTKVHCSSVYATCEPPRCSKDDWVYNEKFNCCPKCRDFAHFCAMNPCHKYATCTDSKRGPICSCKTGFQGNGTFCEDIDECAFSKDAKEQLGGCLTGSVCRNVPGSYKCDCLPGFQMIGDHACLPLIRV